jgi:hypothetical protein
VSAAVVGSANHLERLAYWNGSPVRLDTASTAVTLTSSTPRGCLPILAANASDRITLVLRGLDSRLEPEVAFRVYIGRPHELSADRRKPGYVADLTFFGTQSLHDRRRAASYDISEILNRLRRAGLQSCPITVTFLADASPVRGSRATVTSIEVWRQDNSVNAPRSSHQRGQ